MELHLEGLSRMDLSRLRTSGVRSLPALGELLALSNLALLSWLGLTDRTSSNSLPRKDLTHSHPPKGRVKAPGATATELKDDEVRLSDWWFPPSIRGARRVSSTRISNHITDPPIWILNRCYCKPRGKRSSKNGWVADAPSPTILFWLNPIVAVLI
ncbi:hypothetical protein OIU78_014749 [Salix suchowensis]|nr:hypothetical protein OIU78_014749 [Salix suchowensis]